MRSSREVCSAVAEQLVQRPKEKAENGMSKIKNTVRELAKLQITLRSVTEKSEINIVVDEMVMEVLRYGLGEITKVVPADSAVELATLYYGVLSTCNPELCCAYMARLRHDQPAAYAEVCENFSTETLNTLA